ncbi:flap endonuclease GEN homolog 1 [Monodelphis domestica]|uniref:flap endonuclease GEN homolog 1 n=1 Tax=Monodelphis domestica TaxID=13616 RepID=UPI0024E21B74|nr:flap endonuclease GEN homolog 1 [Monodelphis domestica]XP_056670802.1 flap endonuclease GEN homolog 1 [Monodelphis domestica]
MGVHDLWQILEPVKRHSHLRSLQGKTLAVDLSVWVCEALTVRKMAGTVARPHLRNLFFRISSLTRMGVKLLFVMEGDAPGLKADVMSKRNEARYGPPQSRAHRPTRSSFRAILKECLDMLACLGIPWVQAAGEAEAMCAYLDAHGYVDGCLTNDGDAFLYGAQTVYRNFTLNAKDPHVDCYTMASITSELGLDRDSLIGLAVLLGCDYLPKGVPGVGKEQALRLVRALRGQSLLQRFDQWKEEPDSPELAPLSAKKPAHCSVCSHPGSAQDHERRGCPCCSSERGCDPHADERLCPCEWHREQQRRAVESAVKRRARGCAGFPFREVIREFQLSKDTLTVESVHYRRPDLLSFQVFALEKMEWPRPYACEKLLALLTHHDMTERKFGRTGPDQLRPVRIVHPRVRSGVPCFEVQWQKPEHYVTDAVGSEVPSVLTVEDASLFQAAYPDVAALYQKQVLEAQGRKTKSKRTRPEAGGLARVEAVTDLLSRVELSADPAQGRGGVPPPTEAPPAPAPPRRGAAMHEAPRSPSPSMSEPLDESSVLEALQLSTIDWEGTSFSASPATKAPTASASPSDPEGDPGRAAVPGTHSIQDLRPLRERVCARAPGQLQASSPPDPSPSQRAGSDASSAQKGKESSIPGGHSCCDPQQIQGSLPCAPPGFRLHDSQEKPTVALGRAPSARACMPRALGQPVARAPCSGLPRGQPGPQSAPRRVPQKSVCLPRGSSDEEEDPPGSKGTGRHGEGKPRSSRPPRPPSPEPRAAGHKARAAPVAAFADAARSPLCLAVCPPPPIPAEEKTTHAIWESPLPLAQRLQLRLQRS